MRPSIHRFEAFAKRESRYDFILREFGEQLASARSILDVGCDQNFLKQRLGNKVFGVDISGNPDRVTNLEKEALSFIQDEEYELAVCMEVLEHLDNLHEVMHDLLRVSSKHVLISLPNASSTSRIRGLLRTGRNGKFYGLPFEKPSDRHKWFFSYREIIDFADHLADVTDYRAVKTVFHYQVMFSEARNPLRRAYQRMKSWAIQTTRWHNQAQDVFILFERKS